MKCFPRLLYRESELELEKKIYQYMQPFADEVRGDEIGDVTAVINPDSPVKC